MRIIAPLLTRLVSALLALGLLAAGTIVIIEICAAWFGAHRVIVPTDLTQRLQRWHWDDRAVVTTIIVVGLVGVIAVAVASWTRPPLLLPLRDDARTSLDRRAFEQSTRRQLERIDGVSKARVRAHKNTLLARIETQRRYRPQDLKTTVEGELARTVTAHHVNLRHQVRLRYRGGEL